MSVPRAISPLVVPVAGANLKGSGDWTWHWRPDLPVRELERQNAPLYLYAVFAMRASIVLDDDLVQEALKLVC